MRKRVGIFGGTFSPVHLGHISVAREVLAKGLVDEVWMMPCRRNPLKDDGSEFSDSLRIDLLHKAIEYAKLENDGELPVFVNSMELSMPEPSYTWKTMSELQKMHPDCSFRLIIGGDSYANFASWVKNEWLAENFSPIVYPRPGYEIGQPREGFTILEDIVTYDISSSDIRKKIREGEDVSKYMPWIGNEK